MRFLREEECSSHIRQLNPQDSLSPTGEGHIHEHSEDSEKFYKKKSKLADSMVPSALTRPWYLSDPSHKYLIKAFTLGK